MMKRYLRMIGFITLILVLYFFSSMLAGAAFGLGFLIFNMLGGTEGNLEDLPGAVEGFLLENTVAITAAAAILTLIFFWIIFLIRKESLLKYSGARKTTPASLAWAVFGGVGFYFFLAGLMVLTDLPSFFPEHQELMGLILLERNIFITLLSIGLIVPVFEEMMLRGIIFNRLREELPLAAALVLQALVFGLIHLNVLQGSYAFAGGLLMGVVYIWGRSLWIPVAFHASWNSASIIVVQVLKLEFSLPVTIIAMAGGAAVVSAALLYFKKNRVSVNY